MSNNSHHNRLIEALKLFQQSQYSEAERILESIIKRDRRNFDAAHYLGIIKVSKGDLDRGFRLLRASLQQSQTFAAYSENYANVLLQAAHYDSAIEVCNEAINRIGYTEKLYVILISSLFQLEKYQDVITTCKFVIDKNPNNAFVYSTKSAALSELGRDAEALDCVEKATSLAPRFSDAIVNKGNILAKLKRLDEAFAAYDKALSIKPDLEGAWLGRGNVFRELKRYDEALAAYDKALSIKPDLEGAWLSRGNVFTELKRYDEAFAAYDKAIAAASDPANAYWNKSLALLTVGDFINGWDLYEWRFRNHENRSSYFDNGGFDKLNLKIKQSKDNFKNKDVTVLAEQGIGDEIMFASTLPDLITDAERVSFECDNRIRQLFQRSFPSVAFFERDNKRNAVSNTSDLVVKAGSLCYAYRRSAVSSFQKSYLKVDHQKELFWKEALINHAKSKLKVGISWRGGTQTTGTADRSFPLSAFKDIISTDETYFVNLQYGDVQAEIAHFNDDSSGKLLNCPYEDFNNFDDLAAFISALDLVISVQNMTIHLCGAIGKPCWGLIPFRPEWRYGSEGESMAWYSSVRLYRQPAAGDWHTVLNRVKYDLQKLAHVPAI